MDWVYSYSPKAHTGRFETQFQTMLNPGCYGWEMSELRGFRISGNSDWKAQFKWTTMPNNKISLGRKDDPLIPNQSATQRTQSRLVSLRFNGHFSTWTWVSRFYFIGVKDDGSGDDNWSYKTCKAPVKSPPTNQHPAFLQAGCHSRHPTKSVKACVTDQFNQIVTVG